MITAFAPCSAVSGGGFASSWLRRFERHTIDHDGWRHFAVRIGGLAHRLCFPVDAAERDLCATLAIDASISIRLDALARLDRAARGLTPGPVRSRWRLSAAQRRLHGLRLQAFDRRAAGATGQEIGAALLDPTLASLSATQWKACDAKSKVDRLLRTARTLVAGGYRALLLAN